MIEKLLKHKTKTNSNIIKSLIEIIKSSNVKSLEDLKKIENETFTLSGKILNIEERIDYILSITISSLDYEFLTFEEIQIYKKYKLNIINGKNNEEKLINIIKLYDLANRELLFPFEAYNLIIKNKL